MNVIQKILAHGLTATAMAVGTTVADAAEPLRMNDADVHEQIGETLTAACPNPTPEDPMAQKVCVDATWSSAYNLAANVLNYIAENPASTSREFMAVGEAETNLGFCKIVANVMKDHSEGDIETILDNIDEYVAAGLATTATCIDKLYYAEEALNIRLNQPTQNLVIDQHNCLSNPGQCVIPAHRAPSF